MKIIVASTDTGAPPDPTEDAETRIARLEAAVAARDLFIATIGHELRNPMVPIVLSVDRLRRLADDGDWNRVRSSLATLDKATDVFMRRATQLLDVSRFSNGPVPMAADPVPLDALLREAADRHQDAARRAGCLVSVEQIGTATVRGDRAAIEQIIDNVLLNAFKYGAGRPVVLALDRDDHCAHAHFRDQGEGVPEAAQARIFGLFERARSSDAPGLGIGLYIAAQLAGAMGGGMSVRSGRGRGAEFTLHLPLALPHDRHEDRTA